MSKRCPIWKDGKQCVLHWRGPGHEGPHKFEREPTLVDQLTAERDSLRARCDVLEQECAEWSKLCNQQHALLEAQGKVLPAAYKCGWCVKMAGGDDMAWQATPSMTLAEVQAHTLVCPHNPLVIEIDALRAKATP